MCSTSKASCGCSSRSDVIVINIFCEGRDGDGEEVEGRAVYLSMLGKVTCVFGDVVGGIAPCMYKIRRRDCGDGAHTVELKTDLDVLACSRPSSLYKHSDFIQSVIF